MRYISIGHLCPSSSSSPIFCCIYCFVSVSSLRILESTSPLFSYRIVVPQSSLHSKGAFHFYLIPFTTITKKKITNIMFISSASSPHSNFHTYRNNCFRPDPHLISHTKGSQPWAPIGFPASSLFPLITFPFWAHNCLSKARVRSLHSPPETKVKVSLSFIKSTFLNMAVILSSLNWRSQPHFSLHLSLKHLTLLLLLDGIPWNARYTENPLFLLMLLCQAARLSPCMGAYPIPTQPSVKLIPAPEAAINHFTL